MQNKEIPLKIEVFSQDNENDFIVANPKEILSILRAISSRRNRVALYYNEDNSMVLTLLLAVDEGGIWVDAATSLVDNKNIERSGRIVFVSSHNQAKVQWVSTDTSLGLYENSPAFYLPLPKKLLRLQRRDYYRLLTPEPNALKCIIRPAPAHQHHIEEVTVMDISIGGVALVCAEDGVELHPGTTYPNCEIELPGEGIVIATIEVKNAFKVTERTGEVKRRAGCVFVKPDGQTTIMLQRYVAHMQLEHARKKL
ncbi:MAG: flagellar regulator YcgR PilZN domain-containing protein [Pseudomonadota bacterium]|mgnify:CR=1 FL=1